VTTSARPIGNYLTVGRRFRRSVNLEKDYRGALQNGEYIVTPTAREALHRLAEGLTDGSHARAWTLTGPYGVGKSAFAVFLTRLLCSRDEAGQVAREKLKDADPRLNAELAERGIGYGNGKCMLPILVTARRSSAQRCISESLATALLSERSRKLKAVGRGFRATVDASKQEDPVDTRWVLYALQEAAAAARSAGYSGILLVVDELGKLFEYAARYPQQGDVFLLQELAEHAARSGEFPVILMGLLHQSFEEYGHHLDIGTRREWAKIQGRFGDVAYLEPAEQVIKMVGEAIRWETSARPRGLKASVQRVIGAALKVGIAPPGMPHSEFEKAALAAYPLHPITLVALPYLFRRFAQNERSLFSYLSSMEPFGFQEFLKTRTLKPSSPSFVRLPDLFDYFTSNFGLGLYRQPHALRWLEAADVLERRDDLGRVHRDVVKAVGILNALGEFCHLHASPSLIAAAVEDATSPRKSLRLSLEELKGQSVLTYRKFNDSYRIWEGSDVDIEARIAQGERKVARALGLADSVREHTMSRPIVARRHSFETGALRSFEAIHVDNPDEVDSSIVAETDLDGKVLVCLSESASIAQQFRKKALKAHENNNVLFAIPQQIGELRGAVTELAALRWAWNNTPELRDDRVARREISLRIAEAEQLLRRDLSGLIDPRPQPVGSNCLWFHGGHKQRVRTPADVSQLMSDVCDEIYSSSPKIRNELITRRSLSSAATAARRNLIEAMLVRGDKPLLGMDGYPPERSMYESVLASTGIHRKVDGDRWGFSPPTHSRKHNLWPSWKYLCGAIFKHQPEPVPVADLFYQLSSAPYGVLDGLHPVLLCAFMLVYPDESTLYREGTFLPDVGIADFEVLMRRPELFAIAGSKVSGGRDAVVTRLAKGLKVKAATVPLVRALFQMVRGLPDFAWKTRRLPEMTIALRSAFENAKSPERFLFVEVPQAFGMPAFSQKKPNSTEVNRFFEALNESLQEWAGVAPQVHAQARDSLLDACGMLQGERGWQALRQHCVRIEPAVTEPQLLAFVRRVVQAEPGAAGIDSVLALVANRPPSSWSDADVERLPEVAKPIGQGFRNALRRARSSAGSMSSIDSLAPKDRKRARSLLKGLRDHIKAKAGRPSPEVVRAAVAELVRELDERAKGGKRQ